MHKLGRMTMKSTRGVLGHSLLRSLVRSLIRLLRTARFARALSRAHSFPRSLTHSLRSSWERGFGLPIECVDFISFETTVMRLRHESIWDSRWTRIRAMMRRGVSYSRVKHEVCLFWLGDCLFRRDDCLFRRDNCLFWLVDCLFWLDDCLFWLYKRFFKRSLLPFQFGRNGTLKNLWLSKRNRKHSCHMVNLYNRT